MLAANQISLMSTVFFPTKIHHLSLPEWVAHTFTYINYGAFITSLPTYLDKNMVGFFPCVQFPFWWHFRLLINSRQSKYPKPVFLFFYVFQLSVFSHTLFGRCPARKLLRFMNIWEVICRHGGSEDSYNLIVYCISFLFKLCISIFNNLDLIFNNFLA